MDKIYPLILAGGEGRRLYPLSRAAYPKPFLKLGQKQPLILETISRISNQRFHPPLILAQRRNRSLLAQTLATPASIMLEPVSRNTAASIAVGVLHLAQIAAESVILILPSDHLIRHVDRFYHAIDKALPMTAHAQLVLFGARPDSPSCDYGYIEQGERIADNVFRVKSFTEKPDRVRAARYLAQQSFLWNSGMFLFRAQSVVSLFRRFAPDMLDVAALALRHARRDDVIELGEDFASAEAISFDRAIVEKTDNAYVVPVNMGWRDLGSWRALGREISSGLGR